jgi:hypothetical protein
VFWRRHLPDRLSQQPPCDDPGQTIGWRRQGRDKGSGHAPFPDPIIRRGVPDPASADQISESLTIFAQVSPGANELGPD